MLRFFLALALVSLASTSAQAEISHRYGGRFGVAYVSDPTIPNGTSRALYEGFFSTSVTHQADNGLRFRFELDIIVGNIDDPRLRHMQYPAPPAAPRSE